MLAAVTSALKLWRCSDGQTINLTNLCNGEMDCLDFSDETLALCERLICKSGFVKCSYGACVQNEINCRVVLEQKDTERMNFGICTIAQIPANGYVEYFDLPGARLRMNKIVGDQTKIRFTCMEGYIIEGNGVILCQNGTWDADIPTCERFCPAVPNSIAHSAICNLKNRSVNCTKVAKPSTIASVRCKFGYSSINSMTQQITCGTDGQWHPKPSPCRPTCGERVFGRNSSIVGGYQSTITQIPWHVNIYKRNISDQTFQPICGGTILNAKMIISATHCFSNSPRVETDYTLFRVKTGKTQREYVDDKDETSVQHFSITDVAFLLQFEGFDFGYFYDLSVWTLDRSIIFSLYTLPICIQFALYRAQGYVSPGLNGLIGYWEKERTPDNTKSLLKIAELSVITREKCKNGTTQGNPQFITRDKFCAERLSPDVARCSTDSGNGLVFPIEINGRIKYFLRGVASFSTSTGTCDPDLYSTFINVDYMNTVIILFNGMFNTELSLSNIGAEIETVKTLPQFCTLSFIPEKGYGLNMEDSTEFVSGAYHRHSLSVKFGCNDNYTLKGYQTTDCIDGKWTNTFPECIPFSTGILTGMVQVQTATSIYFLSFHLFSFQ